MLIDVPELTGDVLVAVHTAAPTVLSVKVYVIPVNVSNQVSPTMYPLFTSLVELGAELIVVVLAASIDVCSSSNAP